MDRVGLATKQRTKRPCIHTYGIDDFKSILQINHKYYKLTMRF